MSGRGRGWGEMEPGCLVLRVGFLHSSFFKKILFIYLFIYFWLRWVFVAARGLFLVAASGGYSVAVCGLLTAVASLVAEHGL